MVLRLAQQEVDVFRHEDIAVNVEVVSLAKDFEPVFEAGIGHVAVQMGEPSVAAKGDEVKVAFLLIAPEVERHASAYARSGFAWMALSCGRPTHQR